METTAQKRLRLERSRVAHLHAALEDARELNGLSPFGFLPEELLVQLFRYACGPEPLRFGSKTQSSPSTLARVCHRWREAALADASLWCSFAAGGPLAWMQAVLANSRQRLLDVRVDYRTRIEYDLYQAIFLHLPRISRLEFPASIDVMQVLQPQEASALKTLSLRGLIGPSGTERVEACTFPVLEDLSVHECIISWSSSLFVPSLTRLNLSRPQFENRLQEFSDVLDALSSMPLLQTLTLRLALPPVFKRPSRTVSLPNLSFLSIKHEPEASCVAFLRHVLFPASTHIHLTCQYTYAWQDFIDAIANRLIRNPIPGPSLEPLHSAYISDNEIVCYQHDSPLFPNVKHGGSCFGSATPRFAIEFTSADDAYLAITKTFLTTFPLSGLRYLRLRLAEWYEEGSVETWRNLFGPMTEVRELSVQHWGVEALARALGHPDSRLFPQLERLHVDDYQLPTYQIFDPSDCYEQYRLAFGARKAQGRPLKEVLFTGCQDMTQSHVDGFAEVVDEVHWDGGTPP